ncbi:ATP-binding protein [Lentzea sp. NPDC051838]|uniref:ATP-binding protein n=1 Tax=Lentzea sp. NPDC051838 TaxID=3154849 RepID=UPI0034336C2A
MNRNEVGENHGNVVQAHHVGSVHLTSPAPVPTALNGVRAASGSFVGRDPELASLDTTGLTVVCGLAGVGKTELVLRYAANFPGDKLFVDLQDYDDQRRVAPAQALEEFLIALGVREIPPTEAARAALFRSVTAEREPMLVVIDNARSAAHVRPLLPNKHRTIVTSRHRLTGLDDADHLELGVLPADEATSLVGDAEVAELCGRLPLALRIMAALRKSDPDHDWASELRDVDLDLLDDGDDRSVRAAFELSYRALTEEQRRCFRFAAMIPGLVVTSETAAVLAGGTEARARKLLRDLRTAHLLEPGDRLHDLVRVYAAERVSEEEDQETREQAVSRFFHHLADRAEQMSAALRTPKQAEALHWFDRHRPMFLLTALSAILMRHIREGGRLAWAVHDYLELRGLLHDLKMADQLALDAARNLGDPWMTARAQARLRDTGRYFTDDSR